MDWGREVAFGPPRIARLKPSFISPPVAHPHESRSGMEPGPADGPGRAASCRYTWLAAGSAA